MKIRRTAVILAAALPLAAPAQSPGGGEAPARSGPWLRPITVALSAAAFDDSSGVAAINPRAVATFALPRAVELGLGMGITRVGSDVGSDADSTFGASLAVPWRRTRASFGYALHASGAGARHELEARAGIAPSSAFRAGLAVRRRPFVDVAPALAVDDQLFHEAGPGGALDPRLASRLDVTELRLATGGSPLRFTYAYGEARHLRISDGNHAWTLSAGAGVNVGRRLAIRMPLDVSARWDLYAASFGAVAPAYYSPSSVVSHTPGLEVRRRLGPLELAGEGGYTFASDGSRGWLAGALASLRLGRLSASAHAQVRDDPWYRSRRLWFVVERALP
ncbi:MAG TPA: hypothetical protein VFL83_14065 [Anaeromyxobacter sp.]|nr:hypothetical protein [Anaeromyxobacter sp.]